MRSIDELLEVDESLTLSISFEMPSSAHAECGACSSSAAASRRPNSARPQPVPRAAAAEAASIDNAACRIDLGSVAHSGAPEEGEELADGAEDGNLKYQRRRRWSPARLAKLRAWLIGVSLVGLGAFVVPSLSDGG